MAEGADQGNIARDQVGDDVVAAGIAVRDQLVPAAIEEPVGTALLSRESVIAIVDSRFGGVGLEVLSFARRFPIHSSPPVERGIPSRV